MSRAANAKCISDEAVCLLYYPATSGQSTLKNQKVNTTLEEMQQQMDSGHIIIPSVVKDFGGNKPFAWLEDKLQKTMYDGIIEAPPSSWGINSSRLNGEEQWVADDVENRVEEKKVRRRRK